MISPSVLFHEPKLCLLIHLFFSQVTPLILSAYNGFLEICRVLVASKADVAKRMQGGWTALGYAIQKNNSDVIAYLRSIGAPE